MRRACSTLLAVAGLCSVGCSQTPPPLGISVLDRSGDMQLVCFDSAASTSDPAAQFVLPLACCAVASPLAETPVRCPVADPSKVTPVLHGVITQTARGELAAVDLIANKVLDSDVQIPGFTFIDVGGLPRALVVPPKQPAAPAPADAPTAESEGSAWTFVASAEDEAIRAVATCRLYRGEACGPELARDPVELDALTRMALFGAPEDMVLSPEGDALWVTLPEQGLLARVALSTDPSRPFAAQEGGVSAPTYFPLPAPSHASPAEPASDPTTYSAVCGLTHTIASFPDQRPLGPRAITEPGSSAAPARIRVDTTTGLLLVADRLSPVLRAFSFKDGALTMEGEWPTGGLLRDFAVTAPVPATAPDMASLFVSPYLPSDAPQNTRYLYAVDEIGTVLAFHYDPDAQVLAPLLAPAPSVRYRDRLRVSGRAVALDVIDTRAGEPYLCGTDTVKDLTDDIDAKEEMLGKTVGADAKALVQADLTVLLLKKSILLTSGPGSLRGVFVAVVSTTGTVDILDVVDLDLACRVSLACDPATPDYTGLLDKNAVEPAIRGTGQSLALTRHAERLSYAAQTAASVAGEESLSAFAGEGCPAGFVEVYPNSGNVADTGKPLVCAPSDPWRAADQTWTVSYETAIPTLRGTSGHLTVEADGALWLSMPTGFDFCARGLEVGDALYVLTNPATGASADCPHPISEGAVKLKVLEARVDRVRVAPLDDVRFNAEKLVSCYPDLLAFEAHTLEKFLVLGSNGGYLHRVTNDANGVCVLDDTRSPLLEARLANPPPTESVLFQNAFVAFNFVHSDAPAAVVVTVRVVGQASRVVATTYDQQGRSDALPVHLHYFSEANQVFVVDAASQGLRRFALTPFTRLATTYR